VVKRFCQGTSGFGESLFLLLVLAIASFHSSALFAPPSLLCVPVGEFLAVWPWAAGPLLTALGTSYISPSQPP